MSTSRSRTGQSFVCRCASSVGPRRSWTSTRRVSSGKTPRSPANALSDAAAPSSADAASSAPPALSKSVDELIVMLPRERDDGDARGAAHAIVTRPAHGLSRVCVHLAMLRAQRDIADDAAEPLLRRETGKHARDGDDVALVQHGANVFAQAPEVDLRLPDHLGHDREIEVDGL